jgi:hypothetical protein
MTINWWYIVTKVDNDIDYSDKLFNKKVKKVLKHPKGWEYAFGDNNNSNTIKFKILNNWSDLDNINSQNSQNAKNAINVIKIRLSSNKTVENVCGFSNKLSCCDMNTKEIWLNFYRWKNGSKESKLPLYKYRNYMINHEVGHALGKLHKTCPCEGCSAPIMMQHTVSIGKCKPNDKPLKGE